MSEVRGGREIAAASGLERYAYLLLLLLLLLGGEVAAVHLLAGLIVVAARHRRRLCRADPESVRGKSVQGIGNCGTQLTTTVALGSMNTP